MSAICVNNPGGGSSLYRVVRECGQRPEGGTVCLDIQKPEGYSTMSCPETDTAVLTGTEETPPAQGSGILNLLRAAVNAVVNLFSGN